MGKSSKKTSKRAENKNGKIKECQKGGDENSEKTHRKRKSFWAKWSRIFSKSTASTKLCNVKEDWRQVEQESPVIMVNPQSLDIEPWRREEEMDANSQIMNIPIGPGRQVSTIILSPTKTGFKAVIAHYGLNTTLTQSLTEDMNKFSTQIENRQTLTLVFDMNTSKFDDVAVGNSESSLVETKERDNGDNNKSISASAIFVRSGTDEIVESAGFLQAQLSFENEGPIQSPVVLPDENVPKVNRRHTSCRNLEKPRNAFKTVSEPHWQEKMKLRKEMIVKQNIQEMLNHFIFLERDDSLMNYPRIREELPSEKAACCIGDSIPCKEPLAMRIHLSEDECKRTERTVSYSFDKLSQLTPSSARNVAPDLLVNIKPFKEPIASCHKLDFKTEKPVPRTENVGVISKKSALKTGTPSPKNTVGHKTLKSKEFVRETDQKIQKAFHKSRLSLCIKCGFKAKGTKRKLSEEHVRNSSGKSPGGNVSKKKTSLETISETTECTLCSTLKMYSKANLSNVSLMSESFDDVLKEIEGYDHNSIFKRNLSQFKRKIKKRTSSIEYDSSSSSVSLGEAIELEEGELTGTNNSKKSNDDRMTSDLPDVALRLIELLKKSDKKTVQLQRFKKPLEKSEIRDVAKPNVKAFFMENSSLTFTYHGSSRVIKVMAQKTEEHVSKSMVNVGEAFLPFEMITFIFPAYVNPLPKVCTGRYYSENKMDECKGCFSKRKIPDLISHLWMDKIDDLRNELITRMNETRMCYDGLNHHSGQLINLKGKQKEGSSRCSVTTKTSIDENSNGEVNGLDRNSVQSAGKSEESEEQMSYTSTPSGEKVSGDFALTQFSNGVELDEQAESNDLRSEDLLSTSPNDQIISYMNPDFKIHSCLTFFVPFVQPIQTAVEILNCAVYSFPVRKAEEQIDKDCLRIMQSYTILPERKSLFSGNELESVIVTNSIERNIVTGQTTSKKQITTITESKSGNHLVVTNEKILMANEVIGKSETIPVAIEDGSNESSDPEDSNRVHYLYYKKSVGNQTVESSETSNYCDFKVSESQSAIVELDETVLRKNQINQSEPISCVESTKEDVIAISDKVNNSLPGKVQLSLIPMKSHSVNLLQKINRPIIDDEPERPASVGEECRNKGFQKVKQLPPSDSLMEPLKIAEDKLIAKQTKESRALIHGKAKASGDKIVKKIADGTSSGSIIGKVGGKIIICRGQNLPAPGKSIQAKRMSVVVTLARQPPSKKTSKSNGSDQKTTKEITNGIDSTYTNSSLPKEQGESPKRRAS